METTTIQRIPLHFQLFNNNDLNIFCSPKTFFISYEASKKTRERTSSCKYSKKVHLKWNVCRLNPTKLNQLTFAIYGRLSIIITKYIVSYNNS